MPEAETYRTFCVSQARHCVWRQPRHSYTCHEEGTTVKVVNDGTTRVGFFRLDGGVFDGNACDFLVAEACERGDEQAKGALLELKGKKPRRAVEQLKTTIGRLRERISSGLRIVSAVVCAQSSIPSPTWQQKKKMFRNSFDVRLISHSHSRPSAKMSEWL